MWKWEKKYNTSNVDKLLNVTQNLLQGNWSNKWIKYLTMLGDMLILHCPYISSPLRFWIVARPRLEHRIFWRKAFLNIFSLTHIMILFYLQLFSATWKGLLLFYFVLTIHLKSLCLWFEQALINKCLAVCPLKCQNSRNYFNKSIKTNTNDQKY